MGIYSLQTLREIVDHKFQLVGLTTGGNSLEFKFDAAARALKATQRNVLNRKTFQELCIEQGWVRSTPLEDRKNISIRSFTDGPTDYLDALSENTLSLVELFDVRHLRDGIDWNNDVRAAVEEFLTRVRQTAKNIRLFLDSHSSIAFLAGTMLGFKTGTHVEINQKGRGPTTVWRSDDGKVGTAAATEMIPVGMGEEIAVVISLSRNALADVEEYIRAHVQTIGRILHVSAANGPSPKALVGGEHAAEVADQIADAVKALRLQKDARRHVFIAAPNAFTFFLGQHREALGPVTLYEFDFEGAVNGSYNPSLRIG